MSASSDQNITIGQARAAPPGSPEREAFDKAVAPVVEAMRRIDARMRPAARMIAARARREAARKPLRPAPAPRPRPMAAPRQRRASAPRKAARPAADPEPSRPPGDPPGPQAIPPANHRHPINEQPAACSRADGGTMSMILSSGADPSIVRALEAVWRLGPRVMGAAMGEIEDRGDARSVLARYARLSPDMLRAVGGDRWPPSLSPMPGGRAAS